MCLRCFQQSSLEKSLEGWNFINSFILAQELLVLVSAIDVIQLPFVMQMLAQQNWLVCLNKLSFRIEEI